MTASTPNIKTAADRAEAWHERAPQRKAALICGSVLRKSGTPLSVVEIANLGRTDFAGLVAAAKNTSAWAGVSDAHRATIENALLPKAPRSLETLADLKATLRPDQLRRLSPADRMEILTGTDFLKTATASASFQRLPAESQKTIQAHAAKFGQPVNTAAPSNTLTITTPATAPSKRIVSPGAFAKMDGHSRGVFIVSGGTVQRPQMSRADFTKLSPRQQSDFCKDGGQLTE